MKRQKTCINTESEKIKKAFRTYRDAFSFFKHKNTEGGILQSEKSTNQFQSVIKAVILHLKKLKKSFR